MTKLERYASKYGKSFMDDLPEILRLYCIANDMRMPIKKKVKDVYIIPIIAEVTSEVLGIPLKDIYSKSGKRHFVVARNIISDIAYSEYLFTYKAIAMELGRDHTTIYENLATHVQHARRIPHINFIRSQVLNKVADILRERKNKQQHSDFVIKVNYSHAHNLHQEGQKLG